MIYDVSMTIHPEMTVYKDKPEKKPDFSTLSTHDTGSSHEGLITMSLHTGTHLDYPLHMIKDGEVSGESIPDGCIGPVKVFEIRGDVIDEAAVKALSIQPDDVVFFKTRNSNREDFDFEFVYVSASGAEALKAAGIKGVGLDALGIERAQADHPTHKILLSNHIFILEGLRLKEVPEGTYELYCLPLKIKGVDALPARVILKSL